MTDDPTERDAKASKGLGWARVPFKAAKERVLHASMLARQSYPVTFLAWCEMQESAQALEAGGKFKLSRIALARDAGVDLGAIDAIFAAFVEVGLIVDGECATFVPKEITRDRRAYEKKKTAQAASKPSEATRRRIDAPAATGIESSAARDAETEKIEAPASQIEPCATQIDLFPSQSRTESSESSSTTTDLTEVPLSSSSGEPACATTTTEGIFSKVVEAVEGKIPELVIRRGVESVRKWIEAGYDLDGDILPELAEIAAYSRAPLRTFQAPFIAEQIAKRRARRIAETAAASAARPTLATPAEAAFSRGPPPFHAPRVDYEEMALREMLSNG